VVFDEGETKNGAWTLSESVSGFDMDQDYTKDYSQEDVLRGLESSSGEFLRVLGNPTRKGHENEKKVLFYLVPILYQTKTSSSTLFVLLI